MEHTLVDKRLAEAFPPGDYLAEELDERGWSQADFAAILAEFRWACPACSGTI